jgi:hypothetical protein
MSAEWDDGGSGGALSELRTERDHRRQAGERSATDDNQPQPSAIVHRLSTAPSAVRGIRKGRSAKYYVVNDLNWSRRPDLNG